MRDQSTDGDAADVTVLSESVEEKMAIDSTTGNDVEFRMDVKGGDGTLVASEDRNGIVFDPEVLALVASAPDHQATVDASADQEVFVLQKFEGRDHSMMEIDGLQEGPCVGQVAQLDARVPMA